ncbi:MAG: response regulator [Chitinophagaceae bacterium]|nr:MAG: response regulator [Chitinophagaceae bacterium]
MYQPKRILFVEDDFEDRELLIDAVRAQTNGIDIAVAENGLQAVEYLASIKGGDRRPCLIVLDLNLPFIGGREVFGRICADESLKNIPVIIFTSSLNPHDKEYFNSLGAEFISKPMDYKEMNRIAGHIIQMCGS